MNLFGLTIGAHDIIDIVLVSGLLCYIFQLLRGTRALAILVGLGILSLVYYGSTLVGLYTLSWLLQYIFGSIVILVVVIFQADIRQALGEWGSKGIFRRKSLSQANVDAVVEACVEMARMRVGALIVFQRGVPLEELIKRDGVRLDALITRQLLMNIFYPKAPMHDGAVIINDGRIAAAACILPLAIGKGQNFGTRHRAALGITEGNDAIAIVVSEERGEISLAINGELIRPLDAGTLRKELNGIFQ